MINCILCMFMVMRYNLTEVCTLGLSSSMHAVLVIFVSNIIVLCYSFLPYAVSIAFL